MESTTNYLITGGSGRLGKELKKHLWGQYPTHREFDIELIYGKLPKADVVVHLAAYTNVDKAQDEKFDCFYTNIFGTYNMLRRYEDKPFVYLSTEHVNGKGIYFQSKLIGEMMVENLAHSYLIIRTLFKPNPYPYDSAWTNQMTQGDYVDVIAELIAKEIKEWDRKSKTVYVGTGRKSMYELAKRTNPNVMPSLLVSDIRPTDYL